MKKGNRTAARLACLLLACLLLAGAMSGAMAASDTGSITFKLTDKTFKALPKGARVAFTLYRIGVADSSTDTGWRIDDAYAEYDVLKYTTASWLAQVAATMAEDLEDEDVGSTMTMKNGVAAFDRLEPGVYLAAMTEGPEGLEVSPVLLTLPRPNAATGAMEYDYDVIVKDAYAEPTEAPTTAPSASPTASPAPSPTATPRPGGGGGGGGGGVPQPTPLPTTEISGAKVWDDEDNAHNTRPGSIEVRLFADGVPVDVEPTWTKSKGNVWTYTFGELPAVTAAGIDIHYTVEETPVGGYETSISGTTITNRLIPKEPREYIDLEGAKTWNDDDNADGARPLSITVRLFRDGVEIDRRTVTAGTDWRYSFGHLPVDDGYGNVYTYTIREDAVPDYFSRVSGMDLVNTRLQPSQPNNPDDEGEVSNGTPTPNFATLTDEALEELLDLFGYNSPLVGILQTGDEIPLYPFLFGGIGVLAIVALALLGRKRKRFTL